MHQHDAAALAQYAPDLLKDRVHLWLDKFYYVPLIVLGISLFALGGWPLVMSGVFLRVALEWHFACLVNLASHMWGRRRFATKDDSYNTWWVALLTFGEGWHNNHHAYPASARHGLAWYEIDINWWGIRVLEFLGLAKSIRVVRLLKETFPDRYHHLPHGRALLAVWRTPRVYHDHLRLIDMDSGALYGTLGYGLEDHLSPGPSAPRTDIAGLGG